MHGRPRKAPLPEDADASAASAAKAAALRDLQTQLLHNHRNRIYTKEALEISWKLLEINPECFTPWNYRKLALEHNLAGAPDDEEAAKSAINDELRIVEMALRQNPKSYGAWYHRKWVLSKQLVPINFEREFQLLDRLLAADARNFHGWNYRRFLAKLKNVSDEEELKFTMKMIDINFSNYSAWHNRSAYLSQLLKKKAEGFSSRENILNEEYELVRQALFTDPGDQSGWFYHLWLLDQTIHQDSPKLVSSWPVNGSVVVLSPGTVDGFQQLSLSNYTSSSFLHTGTFPIVLYFNKYVENVNSSTVTVNSKFFAIEDLKWKPVSTQDSGMAHCWAAFVKVPDEASNSSSPFTVEVDLGRSKDSIISDGSLYNSPLQFRFDIIASHHNLEKADEESGGEQFTWNFSDMIRTQESHDAISLEQLNVKEDVQESLNWKLETLANEIVLFKELADEDSKFVKLTLSRFLVAHDALISNGTEMRKKIHSGDISKLYDDLVKLDPTHKNYYEDERSLILMDQLTSDKSSLLKHTRLTNTSSPSWSNHLTYLQMEKLSLTRIGSTEHLLWVQMLDLSHNKLHSVAGLEALQLLVCLNLSHNQISSFTALEPLRHLSYLRVLDLSYNEIGSHAIDTTRYLCSSLLSHSLSKNHKVEDWKGLKVKDNWEVVLFFQALHLTQLDIKGNAVADENFQALVKKLLPSIIWLDGESV